MASWTTVPVRFSGGPLDGEVNTSDYTAEELRDQIGDDWDFTPATIDSTAPDVIERYRMAHEATGWVYRHIGTFERPVSDRNFEARFVGGPRDGETATLLGSVRGRPELAASLFPGYVLVHTGTAPMTGWELRHGAANR